jgi:hypothetical protein
MTVAAYGAPSEKLAENKKAAHWAAAIFKFLFA